MRQLQSEIDELIEQIQQVRIRDQQAEEEENWIRADRLLLRAKQDRLVQELSKARGLPNRQVAGTSIIPGINIGDRVVIKNPKPPPRGRAPDPRDAQGILIRVTRCKVFIRTDNGREENRIPDNIRLWTTADEYR